MLGIRKYREIAVDLWLGSPASFVADAILGTEELARISSLCNFRHLVLVPEAEDRPAEIFSELLLQLGSLSVGGKLRRVTLILEDKPRYQAFQTALFATFPEL